MPFIAAVEIDQRQRFIQQSDTLREMVGASRMIGYSIDQAKEDLKESPGVMLFWPVSGVLRFYSDDLGKLGAFLEKYRRSLEMLSLTCSIGALQASDRLDEDLGNLDTRVRRRKDAASNPVAIPTTPYFAPCSILSHLPATHWDPGAREPERRLRSWQAAERERFRNSGIGSGGSALHIPARRLPTLDQLVGSADSRSYIGLIKGDVDGLGRVLSQLEFEHLSKFPEIRSQLSIGLPSAHAAANLFVRELTSVLEGAIEDAYENVPADKRPSNLPLPYRHLIVAGDDLFILARRDIALSLACEIEDRFAERARNNATIQVALQCAGILEPLTLSLGVLFAKYGYPFDASFDLVEDLMRSAKTKGRNTVTGGIDFHWLSDSARPQISSIRDSQFFYRGDSNTEMWLTTLPWSSLEARGYLKAAELLRALPRRKLKQLDTIARLGRKLSDFGYNAWRKRLREEERTGLDNALKCIEWPDGSSLWRDRKQDVSETCFLDLVQLTEVIDL